MLAFKEVLNLLTAAQVFTLPDAPNPPLHQSIYLPAPSLASLGLLVPIQKTQQPILLDGFNP